LLYSKNREITTLNNELNSLREANINMQAQIAELSKKRRYSSFAGASGPSSELIDAYGEAKAMLDAGDADEGMDALDSLCNEANHAESCFDMALIFGRGKGVDRDLSKANAYLKRACDAGYRNKGFGLDYGCMGVDIIGLGTKIWGMVKK